ncbi:MAG: hypothetical protein US58_C0026G0013, partial [Candidatus Magasanikbacteria bacterium GW2011_GWA2_37_8]
MIFQNRRTAGQQLAKKLLGFKNDPKAIVLGLPRGGVITAHEIAKILNLPLDIIVTRKIGAPYSKELAIGALSEDGRPILNHNLIQELNVSKDYLDREIEKERREAKRRLEKYRHDKPKLNLKNKTVILVDDGIATGYTMFAAVDLAKIKEASKIIIASPVIASDTLDTFKALKIEVVYLDNPSFFSAIGQF